MFLCAVLSYSYMSFLCVLPMIHQIFVEKLVRPIVKRRWQEISKLTHVNPFDPPFEWKMIRTSWVARYMWGQMIDVALSNPLSLDMCRDLSVPDNAIILVEKSKKHDMLFYTNCTFYIVNSRYLVDPMCLSLVDPKELICMLVKDFLERPKEIRWM